jgi:hypothetical protein
MAGTDRSFGPGPSKRAQPKRQAALQFGLSAESRAVVYLLLKGYRIGRRDPTSSRAAAARWFSSR